MTTTPKTRTAVTLTGVPETLLWPLWNRAAEARHPERLLDDPRAIEIVDAIDYPFEATFGRPDASHALRALGFDREIRRFLDAHPDATVVGLGEGLETQCLRVDNGRRKWLAVDLPETIAVRERFIPDDARHRNLACSALDVRWMDEVEADKGVFITAAGLLYYFAEHEVASLIGACSRRFPRGEMMFDTIPRWLSTRTLRPTRSTNAYRAPPMPWGIDLNDIGRIRSFGANIADVRDVDFPNGRGLFFGVIAPALENLPVLRNKRPAMVVARFGDGAT